MDFASYLPIWNKLDSQQQQMMARNAVLRKEAKGTIVHNGSLECTGVLLVGSGQLRAYILSEDGREITIYRLFERDMCMLSATCIMSSIQFDITIEVEKDAQFWVICPDAFKRMMAESALVANYTNELMATRFSDVMWLMEQVLWKSFDKRLANFLLQECEIEDSKVLKITHETIGNHLGNPREVVTRMLRYFQNEGFVKLSRGAIEIVDEQGLAQLSE